MKEQDGLFASSCPMKSVWENLTFALRKATSWLLAEYNTFMGILMSVIVLGKGE